MTPDLNAEIATALRSWVEFFEEQVTVDGGPISMSATFDSDAGQWSLAWSAAGSVVVDPEGAEHDVDSLLKEHA